MKEKASSVLDKSFPARAAHGVDWRMIFCCKFCKSMRISVFSCVNPL